MSIKLCDANIGGFKPAKTFTEHKGKVTSLSFSPAANMLISGGDDDQLAVYDAMSGGYQSSVYSRKYGCSLLQFVHTATQVIYASTKKDDAIRFLSLHENKYIRYFSGHTKKVVSLHVSPVDDHFISGSLDSTIRLWDLRCQTAKGIMHLTGRPVAAFDPEGLIFVAGINSEQLKLYDLRTFDKGPFVTFQIPPMNDNANNPPNAPINLNAMDGAAPDSTVGSPVEWSTVKFSPNGKTILICSNGTTLRLVDGYKGNVIHTFTMPTNAAAQMPLDATFTPDSNYVMCGGPDGKVHVWNTQTGIKVAHLVPTDSATMGRTINSICFNPKFGLLATGSTAVSLWLPAQEDTTGLKPPRPLG